MWSTSAFTSLGRVNDQRRIALVTGASSGIGEATVRALAAAGSQIARTSTLTPSATAAWGVS